MIKISRQQPGWSTITAIALFSAIVHPSLGHAADWDGFRNRLLPNPPRVTQQDFGFRPTNHAGGDKPGEIGGRVQRSTVPAS